MLSSVYVSYLIKFDNYGPSWLNNLFNSRVYPPWHDKCIERTFLVPLRRVSETRDQIADVAVMTDLHTLPLWH